MCSVSVDAFLHPPLCIGTREISSSQPYVTPRDPSSRAIQRLKADNAPLISAYTASSGAETRSALMLPMLMMRSPLRRCLSA